MDFPAWKPQMHTQSKFGHSDKRVVYKALRNSSSAFISRKDVREAILSRDDHRCCKCGGTERLQIDHVIAVLDCANGFVEVEYLNHWDNLQTLCGSCNSSKPYEKR